ncbi:hypothetical protein AB6825_08040 [Serratia proteamaculans]|uniref:hypothetical protein n=1 Tax=Serratia proteamaculans TaxID=28151 RepID=UPI0039BE0597
MNITEVGDTFNCDCGFSWKRGFSGSHDCGDGLRRQIADLNVQILANHQAQPVALIDRRPGPSQVAWRNDGDKLPHGTQLFTAPPAPVVNPELTCATAVPKEIGIQEAKELFNYLMTEEELNATVNGYNACRAAMLSHVGEATDKVDPVMICDTCGHDADHQGNRTYKCDSGHAFHIRSEPVSQGYKLVPVEPTPKQWAAGVKAMDSGMDKVTLVYKAMLATAPTQGENQ